MAATVWQIAAAVRWARVERVREPAPGRRPTQRGRRSRPDTGSTPTTGRWWCAPRARRVGPRTCCSPRSALRASATATLRRLGGPGRWLLALPVNYVAGLQVVVRSAVGEVARAASSSTTTPTLPPPLGALGAGPHLRRARADAAASLARQRLATPRRCRRIDAILLGGGPGCRSSCSNGRRHPGSTSSRPTG